MSQHMEALALANATRYARAKLKAEVRDGEKLAAEVLRDPPECVLRMPVLELLMAQHRWGRGKARKVLAQHGIGETKTIGSLTARQSFVLSEALLWMTGGVA